MTTGKELARFYEEHGDDPDLWEEPEQVKTSHNRGQMAATITVRFPDEEASLIRQMSKQTGMSFSEIIRKAVRQFARPQVVISGEANVDIIFSRTSEPHARPSGRVEIENREQYEWAFSTGLRPAEVN